MHLLNKVVELENEATEFGFAWETPVQIMEQIQSECGEVSAHLQAGEREQRAALQEEIGDLLHAVFSLCVFCGFSPEETLQQTLEKFERRLEAVKKIAYEEQQVLNLKGRSFEELMAIWRLAKQRVG